MKTTRKPRSCSKCRRNAICEVQGIGWVCGHHLPTTRKPRLTPKEKVLRRWPEAETYQSRCTEAWAIWLHDGKTDKRISNWFPDPSQAWADAASRLT